MSSRKTLQIVGRKTLEWITEVGTNRNIPKNSVQFITGLIQHEGITTIHFYAIYLMQDVNAFKDNKYNIKVNTPQEDFATQEGFLLITLNNKLECQNFLEDDAPFVLKPGSSYQIKSLLCYYEGWWIEDPSFR